MTSARRFWIPLGLLVVSTIACAPFFISTFDRYVTEIMRRDFLAALDSKLTQDFRAIETGCAAFAADHEGRYPESLAELWLPRANGRTYPGGTQPPVDAWRNEYHYEVTAGVRPMVRIWTLGRDGVIGGEGLDADVGNWTLRE